MKSQQNRIELVTRPGNPSLGIAPLNILEEKFGLDLLKVLLKAVLGTNEASEYDSCSFSIQEVLKIYKCQGPDKLTTPGGRMWNMFTDSEREILQPLFKSLYLRAEPVCSLALPVYKHSPNYKDWITNWSFHLIDVLPNSSPVKSLFVACKPGLATTTQLFSVSFFVKNH